MIPAGWCNFQRLTVSGHSWPLKIVVAAAVSAEIVGRCSTAEMSTKKIQRKTLTKGSLFH